MNSRHRHNIGIRVYYMTVRRGCCRSRRPSRTGTAESRSSDLRETCSFVSVLLHVFENYTRNCQFVKTKTETFSRWTTILYIMPTI